MVYMENHILSMNYQKKYKELGISMFKDDKYINQVYIFTISTLDNKIHKVVYFQGTGSDCHLILFDIFEQIFKILQENNIHILTVCSDGDSACIACLNKIKKKNI